MKRFIIGFIKDVDKDWCAILDCKHKRHFRHHPPFYEREWTQSLAGRRQHLGMEVECQKCEMPKLPEGLEPYRVTDDLKDMGVARELLNERKFKEGVWAKIIIRTGHLKFIVGTPSAKTFVLNNEFYGILPPKGDYSIEALPDLEFFIEFYQKTKVEA